MQQAVSDRVTAPVEQSRWVEATDRFEAKVSRRLCRLARGLRLLAGARGAGLLAATVVALAGMQLSLDWLFRLRADMRFALLVALGAALVVLAWRLLVRPFRVPVTTADTALLIERRFPDLRDRLVSAVQFAAMAPQGANGFACNSPAMMRQVLAAAERQVSGLPIGKVIDSRRVGAAFGVGIAAALVAIAAFAAAPEVMSLWLRRNVLLQDVAWPQLTHLLVEGLENGELIHPRGDDLTIRASVPPGDRMPRVATVEYAFPDGQSGKQSMNKLGQRTFVAEFARVRRPLRFRLAGGDERTDWYNVRLLDRPRIESLQTHVYPPAYTGLPQRDLRENATVVDVLPGAEVRFALRANVPLKQATLVAGDEPADEAAKLGDERWQAAYRPTAGGKLHFELLAENGLRNVRPVEVSVRMLEDGRPQCALKLPGVGEMITRSAVLPVELDFADDYGLAEATLVVEAEPGMARRRELPLEMFSPGTQRFRQEMELPVESLEVAPGDRLTLHGQASDFDDISGPNVGQSLSASLRVVAEAELLAELARREQEYRYELEKLIQTQERVRADLLSWMADAGTAAAPAERALERLHRQQKHIAMRTVGVEQQVAQIIQELEINRVLEPAGRQRLGAGVAEPLADLGRHRMPAAVEAIAALGGEPSGAAASAVDGRLAEIVAEMRRVLANMVKWEGFQEAVRLLRDIVELQGEVGEETQKALERRIRETFGTAP